MADDDSWLYGEDNDEVEEPEAVTEEVEAVKGEMIQSSNRLVVDRNKPRNFGLWCTVSGLLMIMFYLAMVN